MWKDIEGFENRYQIDENGNIKNVKSLNLLSLSKDRDGYLQIGIRKLGDRKKLWFRVHRLVALAFLDGDKTKQIDHIDRNKENNNVANLRWVSALENCNNRQDTAWKTNKSGELYISKYTNGYMLRINRSDLKHMSWHRTIESAILKRSEVGNVPNNFSN